MTLPLDVLLNVKVNAAQKSHIQCHLIGVDASCAKGLNNRTFADVSLGLALEPQMRRETSLECKRILSKPCQARLKQKDGVG